MDDLKKISSQFLDAANVIGAPKTSMPELASYFKASAMDPTLSAGLSGSATATSQAVKTKEEQEEAARQARAAALQQEAENLDPSNFRKVRKADGGFAFYDPSGKQISINDYAAVTGDRRADILSDSENPVDLEYINDYNNMNELAQAMYNGDTATIQQFAKENGNYAQAKPQDLMKELIKKYPHIYGLGGSGGPAYQQTLQNRGKKIFSPFGTGGAGGGGGGASSGGGWRPS